MVRRNTYVRSDCHKAPVIVGTWFSVCTVCNRKCELEEVEAPGFDWFTAKYMKAIREATTDEQLAVIIDTIYNDGFGDGEREEKINNMEDSNEASKEIEKL